MGPRTRQDPCSVALRRGVGYSHRTADARAYRMNATPAQQRPGERGFTLIETIVGLGFTGLGLSRLASIPAKCLPSWNRGIDRIQRSELMGIALQRIGADLASAEYVPANRDSPRPLFDGTELSVI